MPALSEFYAIPPGARDRILLDAIHESHAWHFARNASYRATMSARGVGDRISPEQLPRLLRTSAITFKGYIEQLGTPFPQDHPQRVLAWLADQLSFELPTARGALLRSSYSTLEGLLAAIEALFSDAGLEIVTSSGTSGRFTLLVRNRATVTTATDAYFTAIGYAWDIGPQYDMVFVMPAVTRVAMARIAHLGTRELEWAADSSVAYTMPFKADPDTIRVRTGRTFRPGLRGLWERRVLRPFMVWAYEALAKDKFIKATVKALERSAAARRPVMLLGGLVQLDAVGQHVLECGGMELPAGSRIATGGGVKELYPRSPDQIRTDLGRAMHGPGGVTLPVTDIYGMAEANWAAFQCPEGNYHMPPWVYVGVMDDDDRPVQGSDITGLLAFWDPLGGGDGYPPFFQTADWVRLVNGNGYFDAALVCPCGTVTPYLVRNTIQRVDLIEEAGCGATL
jgi:hypothetical protein